MLEAEMFIFKLWALICHFDIWYLIFDFILL